MSKYASGRDSWAVCDQCGLRGHYSEMLYDGNTGLFVHPEHLLLGYRLRARNLGEDGIALRYPRPETPEGIVGATQYFASFAATGADGGSVYQAMATLTASLPLFGDPGLQLYWQANFINSSQGVMTIAAVAPMTINNGSSFAITATNTAANLVTLTDTQAYRI